MSKDLSNYRDKYLKGELIENNLPNNPLDLFSKWFFELENNGNSVILSAESDSLHIWIITVMDILNKYGFNEVQIRTIEK